MNTVYQNFAFIFLILLSVLVLNGCETVPNSRNLVTPQAAQLDIDLRTAAPGDLIHLRSLTSDDFAATQPTAQQTGHQHSSLSILVSPHATLAVREDKKASSEKRFQLLAKDIHYAAVMDKRYSWLQPTLTKAQRKIALLQAYIHFALYELAARQLNQIADKQLTQGYYGTNPDQPMQQFSTSMTKALAQVLSNVETQIQDFNQQTETDPVAHSVWLRKLEQELVKSAQSGYIRRMQARYPGFAEKKISTLAFKQSGLYQPSPCAGMILKLQSLGQLACVSPKAPEFKQSTRTIPLRKGITFGVQFEPEDLSKRQWAELDVVTLYPEPGVTAPSSKRNYRTNLSSILVSGKPSLYLYQLAEDWELIPGTWRFEFYSQGEKIAEHTFEVVL